MSAIDDFLATVSNKNICDWFFFMYVLAVISAFLQLGTILFSVFSMKNKINAILIVIGAVVGLGIMLTQSLFLYSLCDRSLMQRK